jgi:hypothetical protein
MRNIRQHPLFIDCTNPKLGKIPFLVIRHILTLTQNQSETEWIALTYKKWIDLKKSDVYPDKWKDVL